METQVCIIPNRAMVKGFFLKIKIACYHHATIHFYTRGINSTVDEKCKAMKTEMKKQNCHYRKIQKTLRVTYG